MKDPEKPKIEVAVAIPPDKVLEEVNALVEYLDERLSVETDEYEVSVMKVTQLLALGALYKKWILENPESYRDQYEKVTDDISTNIQ